MLRTLYLSGKKDASHSTALREVRNRVVKEHTESILVRGRMDLNGISGLRNHDRRLFIPVNFENNAIPFPVTRNDQRTRVGHASLQGVALSKRAVMTPNALRA
jgi:hypothetical protein